MDFGAVQNTFIWSSCSILLGKVAGVHGLEWHECDAFEALNKIGRFGSLGRFARGAPKIRNEGRWRRGFEGILKSEASK